MLAATESCLRKILLVDDDPFMLASMRSILQQSGYHVLEAGNGEDALALAQQYTFDLAMLDAFMPGMSGLELAQHLQQKFHLAFMFVTGSSDAGLVQQATEVGAVGYLVKPVEPAQMIATVKAALARGDEIKNLRRSENDLTLALHAARETSMAVGLLMAKFTVDRDTSFELLRNYARSHRSKIHDVAKDLLDAEELMSRFTFLLDKNSKEYKNSK
jgi:CheY-like chemotaxis protein